jgi:hypothetical protein
MKSLFSRHQSSNTKKTLKFSASNAKFVSSNSEKSQILLYMPIRDIFGVVLGLLEIGLIHKTEWLKKLAW